MEADELATKNNMHPGVTLDGGGDRAVRQTQEPSPGVGGSHPPVHAGQVGDVRQAGASEDVLLPLSLQGGSLPGLVRPLGEAGGVGRGIMQDQLQLPPPAALSRSGLCGHPGESW